MISTPLLSPGQGQKTAAHPAGTKPEGPGIQLTAQWRKALIGDTQDNGPAGIALQLPGGSEAVDPGQAPLIAGHLASIGSPTGEAGAAMTPAAPPARPVVLTLAEAAKAAPALRRGTVMAGSMASGPAPDGIGALAPRKAILENGPGLDVPPPALAQDRKMVVSDGIMKAQSPEASLTSLAAPPKHPAGNEQPVSLPNEPKLELSAPKPVQPVIGAVPLESMALPGVKSAVPVADIPETAVIGPGSATLPGAMATEVAASADSRIQATASSPVTQLREAIVQRTGDRFQVALDPPELGTVRIELDLSRTGQARIVIAASEGGTLDLLKQHGESLAADLSDQGFDDIDIAWSSDGGAGDGHEAAPENARHPAGTADRPTPSSHPIMSRDGRLDWKI